MMGTIRTLGTGLLLLLVTTVPASAQDGNVLMTVDSIEHLLARASFEIVTQQPSRGLPDERTSRTVMSYEDGTMLAAKWAPAVPGGEAFNNKPRYELATYELQKLFLDPAEYVVPPTVVRMFPLSWYRELDARALATFSGTDAILVVLQYWLVNVTDEGFWDPDRFDADSVYARHFANFNTLTYLVRHGDENTGNYLVSRAESGPRVFSVDNGVTFSSPTSDRGYRWRRLRVERLPAATVERLRALTPEDLTGALETVAEYRILPDRSVESVEPGPNLDPRRGVRQRDGRIQMGLTRREIGQLWGRITNLLDDVDRGRLEVF